MGNFLFAARRALFSQPLGMTVNILKDKIFAHRRKGSAKAVRPLPIDVQYGIETGGIINASALRTGSRSDLYSFGYGASVPSIIRRGIETCPNLSQASFVDLGCGKGLPLAVASEYPFRRIVGIELSPTLCATARENAARIARAFPDRSSIEVLEGDMTEAELPTGYVLIYLYNPAYPPLIRAIAKRLAAHQAQGNKVMVIYYNPAGARFFDAEPVFTRHFAAHLPLQDDEFIASEQGNSADSIAVWQGLSEPMYEKFPGATARIARVSGGSSGQVQPVRDDDRN